jgi:hypothetical protein
MCGRLRIGLALLVGIALLTATEAEGRQVRPDMSRSRLAQVEIASKLDLREIEEVGGIIDRVVGKTADVYLLPEDFEALRARGFSVLWIRDESKEYGTQLWERTRHTRNPLDDYHTNAEIAALFAQWQAAYPNYFHYESIGRTVQNRDLWACKVSDNVMMDEPEIEVKYIANMHGDEVVGKENCLRFIEDLLTQRDTVPDYQELMANFEMWFLPLMNPDGNEAVSRYNAHGVDLNRDFPDRCDDSVNTTVGREPETAVVMNWSAAHNFVISANFHGGALVVNYPWDNNCNGVVVYAPTPEDCVFVHISRRYCEANPRMRRNTAFLYPDTGITNGADWYEVSGGMQDWNYTWMGDKDVTIELDADHWPDESRLESLWQENRWSMRYYFLEARNGVRGLVTDSTTGDPVRANIMLAAIPYLTYSSALHGEYYRILRPGTYSLTFSAAGYASKTVTGVTVVAGTPTVLDVQLRSLPRPVISASPLALDEAILPCSQVDVPLVISNTGDAQLNWSALEVYEHRGSYGGAVGGGWRWISSDQAGGPAYQWKDISATGTAVAYASDDQTLGPFPIGFTFPFYGQNFTTYRLCGNGWLSFTSSSTSYSNSSLPSSSAPENLIAAWWDDLSPQPPGSGQVRRWNNGVDSLVISFVTVPSYSGGGLYNFEFIVLSSGNIILQYASMGTARLNSATIGLQNSDRTKGVAVVYNQDYIHNNMAIAFCPVPLVELVPASGSVPAGDSQNVTARLRSCCVPLGIVSGALAISSNDPVTPTLNVAVTLEVVSTPPAAVGNLTVYPEGDGVRLNWSAAANATGYQVYRMDTAAQDYQSGELLTEPAFNDTTFFDLEGGTGTTAFYQVISTR